MMRPKKGAQTLAENEFVVAVHMGGGRRGSQICTGEVGKAQVVWEIPERPPHPCPFTKKPNVWMRATLREVVHPVKPPCAGCGRGKEE